MRATRVLPAPRHLLMARAAHKRNGDRAQPGMVRAPHRFSQRAARAVSHSPSPRPVLAPSETSPAGRFSDLIPVSAGKLWERR